jgi:hypothetical protein
VDDPTSETVFEFPSTVSLYFLPAAVVGSVMIFFVIMTPFTLSNLAVALLVILVVAVQLIFFSRLRYRVAVSDDGIRYMPYGRAPNFLRWSEVASLELRESFRGRLVMSDAARLRTIAVDYQLGRFEELLSIVVDRATNCDPRPALPKIFHSSYLDQIIVVTVFLICVAFSIWFAHFGQALNAAAFGLFALLPLGIFVFLPHSLTVSSDSIALGHLGWRREIAIGSITGMRFGVQTGSRGALWTLVWVDLAGREPLKLTGFTEGSLAVYYALRVAWRPIKDSGGAIASSSVGM